MSYNISQRIRASNRGNNHTGGATGNPQLNSSQSNGFINEPKDPLQGYEEVEPNDWLNLQPGTYVQYELSDRDNKMYRGFVMSKSLEKQMLFIQNDKFNPNSFKSYIPVAKINRLWKKSDNPIAESGTKIETLARIVKQLNDKVSTLEQLEYKGIDEQDNIDIEQLKEENTHLRVRMENLENDVRKISELLGNMLDALDIAENPQLME